MYFYHSDDCPLPVSSGVYTFVVLKKDVDVQETDLSRLLNDMVSKKIAKYACPDFIQVILRQKLWIQI